MKDSEKEKFMKLVDEFLECVKKNKEYSPDFWERFGELELIILEGSSPKARKIYCEATGRVLLENLSLVSPEID